MIWCAVILYESNLIFAQDIADQIFLLLCFNISFRMPSIPLDFFGLGLFNFSSTCFSVINRSKEFWESLMANSNLFKFSVIWFCSESDFIGMLLYRFLKWLIQMSPSCITGLLGLVLFRFFQFSQNLFVFVFVQLFECVLSLIDLECTFVLFEHVTVKKANVCIAWVSVFLIG